MSITVKITPPNDISILSYLEKEAQPLCYDHAEDYEWKDFDRTKVPVILNILPNMDKTNFVLYSKHEFDTYKIKRVDEIKRNFYLIEIDKLWDVSNLYQAKDLIETDRSHSKKAKSFLSREKKAAICSDLVVNYAPGGQRKPLEQIADEHSIKKGIVVNMARQLNRQLPAQNLIELPSKGFDYKMFVRNLSRVNPNVVRLESLEPHANGNTPAPAKAPKSESVECPYCSHTCASESGIYQHVKKNHKGKKVIR